MNLLEERQKAFDVRPLPTWKRAKLPENLFDRASEKSKVTVTVEGDETLVKPLDTWLESDSFNERYLIEKEAIKHLGDSFIEFATGYSNHHYVVEAKRKGFDRQKVKFTYHQEGTLVDQYVIIAYEGAKLDVIIDYRQADLDSEILNQHYGLTRIIAENGSDVKVYKVQQLGSKDNQFEQVFAKTEEGAKVEVLDVELGGAFKAVAYENNLRGRHANAVFNSLYYGENDDKLDLSYTVNHFAKETESTILSKGALDDHAKKVFRGNLFFEQGASKSVGKEEEFVILLDRKVESDSIPALMCSEDDVIGEHAASVGQLDQEKLFYLMSRGFSELEAKKMVIKASFEEVLMSLDDESLKADISETLDRRLDSRV